jgi:capsid protein
MPPAPKGSSGWSSSSRSRSPAERGEEYAAVQRKLKQEAAERREQSAAAPPPARAARGRSSRGKRGE